ncbi:MAG: cell division protein ZapA [Micavibrio sp.]|nr:cell division protein ZapA [Micavibrio sp.]
MAEVNIGINGRSFSIYCEDGQEDRVLQLGSYVDSRFREIAQAGAATNEAHLLVLTSLMMADEVFDLRSDLNDIQEQMKHAKGSVEQEAEVARVIEELSERVEKATARIQGA